MSTACRLGVQMLYCIEALHREGFVHRDIKPSNFVIAGPHAMTNGTLYGKSGPEGRCYASSSLVSGEHASVQRATLLRRDSGNEAEAAAMPRPVSTGGFDQKPIVLGNHYEVCRSCKPASVVEWGPSAASAAGVVAGDPHAGGAAPSGGSAAFTGESGSRISFEKPQSQSQTQTQDSARRNVLPASPADVSRHHVLLLDFGLCRPFTRQS